MSSPSILDVFKYIEGQEVRNQVQMNSCYIRNKINNGGTRIWPVYKTNHRPPDQVTYSQNLVTTFGNSIVSNLTAY